MVLTIDAFGGGRRCKVWGYIVCHGHIVDRFVLWDSQKALDMGRSPMAVSPP